MDNAREWSGRLPEAAADAPTMVPGYFSAKPVQTSVTKEITSTRVLHALEGQHANVPASRR